jgi:hypothetical protein
MSDDLQNTVDRAISLIQKGPSKEGLESLVTLAAMHPSTLLPELFIQVEEASRDIDMNRLRPTDLVPDVDFARDVVRAVTTRDVELLRSTVEGGYPELVIGLVSVAAALKSSASE